MGSEDVAEGTGGLPTGKVVVPEHVVHRDFEKETVLLNLRTGQYYGLNGAGGALLQELEAGGDAVGTARRVAARFGVPEERVAADLVALLSALVDRGLAEVESGPEA